MSTKLLVFAQTAEARATLSALHAKPIDSEIREIWPEGRVPSCYTCDLGWIVISGWGTYAAQASVAKYAAWGDEIWNFGFAGALRATSPIGQILPITLVGKYLPLHTPLDPTSQTYVDALFSPLPLCGNKGKLISSDFPLHDTTSRHALAKQWDLVDMEGYGIAYAAHFFKKPCWIWKIVSDFASPGGRTLIQKHQHMLSERLAELILYQTN